MAEFLQYLIAGLSNGAIYALIALGWVLIFNVSGVLNLAQGEFLMLGALVFAWTEENTGLPIALSIAAGIGAGVLAGVAVDVVAIRRVKSPTIVPLILVTLGASFVLREISRIIFGPDAKRHDYLVGGDPIIIKGAALLPATILIWVVVVVAVVLLAAFFRFTMYGKAMTACSDDPVGARSAGINSIRMRTIAFGVSGGLAAIGGILICLLNLDVMGGRNADWLEGIHRGRVRWPGELQRCHCRRPDTWPARGIWRRLCVLGVQGRLCVEPTRVASVVASAGDPRGEGHR